MLWRALGMIGVVRETRRKLVGMGRGKKRMPLVGFGDRGIRSGKASWRLEVVVGHAQITDEGGPYLMKKSIQQCISHCSQDNVVTLTN